MSIYKSDVDIYVKKSIDSILSQTYRDLFLYVEVDGEIPDSIKKILLDYEGYENVSITFNENNLGLAYRLNSIIDKAVSTGSFSYLARMDADDISDRSRFKKQVEFLEANQDISVVGSDVYEISSNEELMFYKKMDSSIETIKHNIIKKCPLNHPSVMFSMSVFHEGYRYQSHLKNTQDYYLWVDLLAAGKVISNINEPLLYFRVDDAFHTRRGFGKAVNDVKSRLYAFKKLNALTLSNSIHLALLFALRIAPAFAKKWAYRNLR
ncbi:glycosyl transferase [Vibrio natriegens]|nr:glycosyl transferase [Vibrio natriegens]